METAKRMIPYQVYLTESTYAELKKHAKRRQASTIVRAAIDMILTEDHEPYTAGYKQGLKDAINVIQSHDVIRDLSYKGESLADGLGNKIKELE
jgi:hypothetical protein